jgi:D-alanine-D-alanine ligase
MKKRKIRVGIIFGGKSTEHEVSLMSAKNVIAALDREKYDPVLIGIGKDGTWYRSSPASFLLHSENPKLIALNKRMAKEVIIPTGEQGLVLREGSEMHPLDVVFPVLHGPLGEDGTMQGLLKLMDIPFVGPSVLGSAIGLDKDVQKRLLRDAGIAIAKFLTLQLRDRKRTGFAEAKRALGLPLFVKPANAGSSVGVSKVKTESEFRQAVEQAFNYDAKILLEEAIEGREIECAVLGNESPIASVPGEVKPTHEFYSYEAKYIDENGAKLEIPARLPKMLVKKVQGIAIAAFKTLECEGMARVDCFVTKNGKVLVNEINTIPGFTKISMYPKLFEASGLPYSKLINRLIELALARAKREKRLATNFKSN